MNLDRAVLSLADTIILISVLLGAFVSSWWLMLTAFVGLNCSTLGEPMSHPASL